MAEFATYATLQTINAHAEMVGRGWRLNYAGYPAPSHLGAYYLTAASGSSVALIGAHIDPDAWLRSLSTPSVLDGQPARFRAQHQALLATTFPTITAQPAGVDAPIGLTQDNESTFSVTAANATSYQWELSTDDGESWSPIGGATSTTYEREDIATFDANGEALTDENGYQVSCVVTNANGSVRSDAATITTHRATPAEIIAATGATISYWEASQHVYEGASDPAENGDGVTEWRDLSAAAYHWTQAGGDAIEPTYVTAAVNGLPALHIGTSSVRRVTNAGVLVASGDWYAVFAYDFVATETTIDYMFYNNTDDVGFFVAGTAVPGGAADRAGYRNPAGSVFQVPNATNVVGPTVLEGGFVGADLTMSHNGWTNQATHTIAGGPHQLRNLELGSRASSGHRTNVEMYGMAVYSGSSADVKRDLRWYFAVKIGATLG